MTEMYSITRRIRDGNQEAFHELFDCYKENVLRFLQLKLENVETAEDILQDVFIKVWEKRATLREHTSLKSYLLTIANHAALNHLRRKKVELKFQLAHQNMGVATPCTPHGDYEHKELHHHLVEAITELPERPRTVFLMSRFQQLTYREVAEQLNISSKTVECHVGKALHMLRESLQ